MKHAKGLIIVGMLLMAAWSGKGQQLGIIEVVEKVNLDTEKPVEGTVKAINGATIKKI